MKKSSVTIDIRCMDLDIVKGLLELIQEEIKSEPEKYIRLHNKLLNYFEDNKIIIGDDVNANKK